MRHHLLQSRVKIATLNFRYTKNYVRSLFAKDYALEMLLHVMETQQSTFGKCELHKTEKINNLTWHMRNLSIRKDKENRISNNWFILIPI